MNIKYCAAAAAAHTCEEKEEEKKKCWNNDNVHSCICAEQEYYSHRKGNEHSVAHNRTQTWSAMKTNPNMMHALNSFISRAKQSKEVTFSLFPSAFFCLCHGYGRWCCCCYCSCFCYIFFFFLSFLFPVFGFSAWQFHIRVFLFNAIAFVAELSRCSPVGEYLCAQKQTSFYRMNEHIKKYTHCFSLLINTRIFVTEL